MKPLSCDQKFQYLGFHILLMVDNLGQRNETRNFDAQKLVARCLQQTLRKFIDLMNEYDDYL